MAEINKKVLLKPESAQKILEAVLKKVGDKDGKVRPCTLCGEANWTIDNKIVTPWPLEGGSEKSASLPLSFPVYACAMMSCLHCGNTHFLHLPKLGIPQFDELLGGDQDADE
ncbi:MAG: hypothetical protein P8Q93_04285 [Ascidiaceihabitans sp.]|nr:hypothetical protein [Ascidiaceihabitans sp.]